jgi:uncharacterized protein YkwD
MRKALDAPMTVAARLTAGMFAVCVLATAAPVRADRDRLDPSLVVALTNRSRAEARLAPLTVNAALTQAARAKLADMLRRDYFEHRTPDGRQPWWFMQAAGYRLRAAGENLAKGYRTELELQRGWMKSKPHRNNILSRDFTEIGVAVDAGVAVVMFGRPMDTEDPGVLVRRRTPGS